MGAGDNNSNVTIIYRSTACRRRCQRRDWTDAKRLDEHGLAPAARQRILLARTVPSSGAAGARRAGRVIGTGAGTGRAHAPGFQLGAHGADVAVRAMDRAVVGGAALRAQALAGAVAGGCGRCDLLFAGGRADADVHGSHRLLSVDGYGLGQRHDRAICPLWPYRPDHVGADVAVLLPAESVAQARSEEHTSELQ